MRHRCEMGMTLVELIISITIMGIIAGGATALLSVCLQAHAHGSDKSALHREGLIAMEWMTKDVRDTTFLMIPNNHAPTRDLLAVSDMTNEDNDFYFDDPLFPRIDEDMADRFAWSSYGVSGYDDDGDGATDEGGAYNEDEDDATNEDPRNGLDDDGDGNIDEDTSGDMNDDTLSGIAGMDDDGDGQVDEGSGPQGRKDDDEDGVNDEDQVAQIVYEFRSGPGELWRVAMDPNSTGQKLSEARLAAQVTAFTTTYEPQDLNHDPRISITLTLTGDDGKGIMFSEYVFPRNITQKTGKKVR